MTSVTSAGVEMDTRVLGSSGLLLAGMALAVGPLAVPAATAGDAEQVRSRVRIVQSDVRMDHVTARGTVDSRRPGACDRDRSVVLRSGSGRLLGRAHTDQYGRWTIRFDAVDALPGRIEATAPRVRVRQVVCLLGRDTETIGSG